MCRTVPAVDPVRIILSVVSKQTKRKFTDILRYEVRLRMSFLSSISFVRCLCQRNNINANKCSQPVHARILRETEAQREDKKKLKQIKERL